MRVNVCECSEIESDKRTDKGNHTGGWKEGEGGESGSSKILGYFLHFFIHLPIFFARFVTPALSEWVGGRGGGVVVERPLPFHDTRRLRLPPHFFPAASLPPPPPSHRKAHHCSQVLPPYKPPPPPHPPHLASSPQILMFLFLFSFHFQFLLGGIFFCEIFYFVSRLYPFFAEDTPTYSIPAHTTRSTCARVGRVCGGEGGVGVGVKGVVCGQTAYSPVATRTPLHPSLFCYRDTWLS